MPSTPSCRFPSATPRRLRLVFKAFPKALPKAPETQGVRTRRNSGNQVVLQIALSSTSSSSCVLGPLMRWYSMLPSAACSQQLISLHGPTLSCWSGTIVPATQLLPLAPKLGGFLARSLRPCQMRRVPVPPVHPSDSVPIIEAETSPPLSPCPQVRNILPALPLASLGLRLLSFCLRCPS